MDCVIQVGSSFCILLSQYRLSRRKTIPQSMACRITLPKAWLTARTVPMKYHSSPLMAYDRLTDRAAMFSRWFFFSIIKGSLMLGYGTPIMNTARHIPSGKSIPQLTFPLHIMARMAPFEDRAFLLKSFILMSILFSSKMMSLKAASLSFFEERISSYLKSSWILKEGKTRRMPLGILLADSMRKSMRSRQISFLFLLRLSKVKVKRTLLGPALMTLAAICSGDITWRLDSWLLNFIFSYFYHMLRGLRVPEVSRIERGLKRRMSLNVSQGTRHRMPTVQLPFPPVLPELRLTQSRKWLNSSSTQTFSEVWQTLGARRFLTLRQKISTRSKLLKTPSGVSLSSSMRTTPYEVNSQMGSISLEIIRDLQQSLRCSYSFRRSSQTGPQKSSNRAKSVFSLLTTRTSAQSLKLSLRFPPSSQECIISLMNLVKVSLKSYIFMTRNLIYFSNCARTLSKLGERNLERSLLSYKRAESKWWVST